MKTLALLVVILVFPAVVYAGNIYGTLWLNGKPVGQGAQVAVTCGGRQHAAQVDNNGYRVFVPEKGRCNFSVTLAGRAYQAEIASYDGAVKYDFDLVPNGSLRRR
ncbi:MAG TPA: hypothetical protein VF532_10235 [Candidatus Angelobacter sp.]